MIVGTRSKEQLARLASVWRQGEHVLITGGTGSGKTLLARQLDQIRLDKGGHVVAFVCKTQPDATIKDEYKGWTRWKTWKTHPGLTERKILLWPKVEHLSHDDALVVMRVEFRRALEQISRIGKWTVHLDEGLFICDPKFLGLGNQVSMMYQLSRAAHGTMITLAQRPSHLPLSLYANASQCFAGRASEASDLKRLANLDSVTSSRTLQGMIQSGSRHDFIWIPVGTDWAPERINLAL